MGAAVKEDKEWERRAAELDKRDVEIVKRRNEMDAEWDKLVDEKVKFEEERKLQASAKGACVRLPMAEPSGYQTRHVDVQLTVEEGVVLEKVFQGLVAMRAELKDGKPVRVPGQVVRYILQHAKAVG